MPKVSIIMGVYNCKDEAQLIKSVDSIINQSFTDWEFIICNDGSTDCTLSILKKIQEKDSRIRVLSYEKNQGLNYALNVCLKNAKGKYIARQDDDDVSKYNRLEKQVEFLEKNKQYSLVGTCAEVFDSKEKWGEYIVSEKPKKKDFYWNSPFIHPSIMVRRRAYDMVNGYRCLKMTRRCEDLDLFMRMYSLGIQGYNIQEKLYEYRLENKPDVKYRPMKYRIDEAKVRYYGYKAMHNLICGWPFVFKPILIGLIPQKILYQIKKKRY